MTAYDSDMTFSRGKRKRNPCSGNSKKAHEAEDLKEMLENWHMEWCVVQGDGGGGIPKKIHVHITRKALMTGLHFLHSSKGVQKAQRHIFRWLSVGTQAEWGFGRCGCHSAYLNCCSNFHTFSCQGKGSN